MNALYFIILFLSGLVGKPTGSELHTTTQVRHTQVVNGQNQIKTRNVHRFNPRTVVALEDTAFGPNE